MIFLDHAKPDRVPREMLNDTFVIRKSGTTKKVFQRPALKGLACMCVRVCNNVRIFFILLTGLFDVKLCVCPRHLRLQLTFSSPPFPGAVKSALTCLHIGLRLCSCLAIKLRFFI